MRIRLAVALLLVSLVVSSGFVQAVTSEYVENDLVIDFQPEGSNDEIVNRMDSGTASNQDSWDPEPEGVWVGGWPRESLFRLNEVPDTDFTLGLATVVSFNANQIMSGASRVVVRLPVAGANWTSGRVHIYYIMPGTNWTFTNVPQDTYEFGDDMDDLQINFTSGFHQLIGFTDEIAPTDTSPTDGNEVFYRSGRTYAIMDVPIRPDVFYLMVCYVSYPSDSYVDYYWQPDALTADSAYWNRSTVAWYNLYEPDLYGSSVENYNVSLGWSFDFRHGYSNSGACWQQFFYADDGLQFIAKMNKSRMKSTDYLSFMLPFYSHGNANISFITTVYLIDPWAPSSTTAISSTTEWNDFILLSSSSDFSTLLGGAGPYAAWDGWVRVKLVIQNSTRLSLFMWDNELGRDYCTLAWNYSASGVVMPDTSYLWDDAGNYSISQYFAYYADLGGGAYDTQGVHFTVQYALQSTEYQWQQSTPAAPDNTGGRRGRGGGPDIYMGRDFWTGFYLVLGQALNMWLPGTGSQMAFHVTKFLYTVVNTVRHLRQTLRDALDTIWERLRGAGQWLWKVGQRLAGVLEDVLDKVIWLATTIMGMGILAFSVAIFFLFPYITMRLGMAIRAAVKGDVEEAVEQVHAATNTAVKALETVSKLRPGRVLKRLRR